MNPKNPSKKKAKPKTKEVQKEAQTTEPKSLADVLVDLKENSRLKNPLGYLYSKPNPFKDHERATTFSSLILKIYNIALECSHPILEFGEKGEREAIINNLKKEFRDIPRVLASLLPKRERGDRILRYYKKTPALLPGIVERLENELKEHLDSSYRGNKNKKKDDIEKFWESKFSDSYPTGIYIDDRTFNTIALSILAYRNRSSYERFRKLYYEVKKTA